MNIQGLYDIFNSCRCVTTDSRDCPAGALFVALRGASFDGNAYAAQALQQGCAYAVVDNARYAVEGDSRYLLVDDGLQALQQLALTHRRTLRTPVIGVTGTNGKTTTKELIAAVLSKRYNVLYTQGNLNNHIGVPKTLLRLTDKHDIAVIEMGANHPGEIRALVAIAEPDMGIITNVGHAHIEGFGSFEGVKSTKGELYDYLKRRDDEGIVFINGDDNDLLGMADERHVTRRIQYGTTQNNNLSVTGEIVSCDPFLTFRWQKGSLRPDNQTSAEPDSTVDTSYPEYSNTVNTRLIGSYNLYNMLAAAAIGCHFGVDEHDISGALAGYVPSNNRSQMVVTESNRLVVDAYNANPTSMNAALTNFRDMHAEGKMVILGEMGELGSSSGDEHLKIVRLLHTCGLQEIWLVGQAFRKAVTTFEAEHKATCLPEQALSKTVATFRTEQETTHESRPAVMLFDNVEAVKAAILAHRPRRRTILIKGSNATKLFQLPPLL